MFTKFIAKRFLDNLLKEVAKKLPDLAEKIKEEIALRKDAFLQELLEFLKNAVIDFIKKHFGK